jgi:Kef-type K+ transport system membrane component KefB
MKIALNIIGILIFFLVRLAGRKDKDAPLSIKFWLKDNWEQLAAVVLFDVALMLLVFQGGLQFNFEKIAPMLPKGVQLAGDAAMCFLVGLLFAWGIYAGYKKMVIDKR